MAADASDAFDSVGSLAEEIGGLREVRPEMGADEHVRWSARAARMKGRIGTVGGRLYLTNERLVFGPNKYESEHGDEVWAVLLAEIQGVELRKIRRLRITLASGKTERFVGPKSSEAAAAIQAALGYRKAPSSPKSGSS